MSKSEVSSRRLRCKCGARRAGQWLSSWPVALFIHCPSCDRWLYSEDCEAICERKDGKALLAVRTRLHAAWHAGQSSPPPKGA